MFFCGDPRDAFYDCIRVSIPGGRLAHRSDRRGQQAVILLVQYQRTQCLGCLGG
jgi:hypothetical protein